MRMGLIGLLREPSSVLGTTTADARCVPIYIHGIPRAPSLSFLPFPTSFVAAPLAPSLSQLLRPAALPPLSAEALQSSQS